MVVSHSLGKRAGLIALGLLAVFSSRALAQTPLNPEIQIGLVQRFGDEDADKLVLTPLTGDTLTVSFETNGQPETLTTQQLTLEVGAQPLPQPVLQEWVVLSSHRSFESAEESANRWSQQGIATEVAQPNSWQVWAKREDYNTPLLRRLLLESLHKAGHTNTFIDSQVLTEAPRSAFIANGYRYNRHQFRITSANRRVQIAENGGSKQLFGGDFKLQPNAYGTYTLVNQVPIELYLRGVVPHEIGPGAPQTAVEAQAVLARTYALRNLRRFAIDNYELCADTQCQVYRGLSGVVQRADRAIAATQGQVLTYNGELIDALYSSTTGGITARFSDVWNGADRPYLQPVIDSIAFNWDLAARPLSDENNFRAFINLKNRFNEDDWPTFRWQRSGTLAEITTGVKEYLTNRKNPLANLTTVTALTVTERSLTGRVQTLLVNTDVGDFELHKNEVVSALIPPRSQLFYLEPMYETKAADKDESKTAAANPTPSADSASKQSPPVLKGYTFVGGGFGHGVGMSQTGSYRLGENGWPYQRILQFYYPNTQLLPISNEIVFWQDPETSSEETSQ
ncbi:SpoIID/LytB domain-containing protein [Leptolyngbya cf. ectocarpi LEGE 11479]|uniref:SpoIID/LytB domain-containing protein n=1 Tax=Leptolyngbya cf. ectocarpi LEGE 11479 TaxID=1828722 RepID=A0A928ZY34_LEPEC|nr:SpoIID/LytB domain-containing protein [Leptolyngbya ectocarpi]MBE9069553.1 SpoIID/LytB domain-containing protein [Leptolyngbya cf. ectocarpi LEGE 11479]